MRADDVAVASERLRPPGTQSTLSRASTVISPASGSTVMLIPDGNAVFRDARHRIVPRLVGPCAGRKFPDRGLGPARPVGHPVLDEGVDGLGAVALHDLDQALLGNPARAELGLEVAVPDLARADLRERDTDDVRLALVPLLDADAGEVQPLLVDGGRPRKVSGGKRCAHVGVVAARQCPEAQPALDEDGHDEVQIGMVGGAEIGAVVEKRVAFRDVIEVVVDRARREVERRDVDGEPVLRR